MRTLLAALLSLSAGALAADGPVRLTLADFTDADGKAPNAMWSTDADGIIHLKGKGGGALISKEEYASFELTWEWKLEAKGNNGIKYWVAKIGKEWLGVEYQMIDDNGHPDGLRGGSHNTGSIYDIVDSAKDKALKPVGEWNSSRILVKDGRIEHFLNGRLVSSADTKSEDWKAAVGRSKFRTKQGFAPGKGRLMLTEHSDPCWFRGIAIRPL